MQKAYINQGLANLSNILNDLKVENVFLIVGSKSFEKIQNIIKPHIVEINIETFIVTDSNVQTIISGCEQINKSNSDLVIAIGGGRIIDAAKLISTNAFSNDNYKNIIKGNEIIKNKFLPLLVMPTTAGTGSEATHFSVVYLDEKKYSVASKKLLPEYVIADTSLVQKMPSYLKACTLFDAFSQAIESFWSVNSTVPSKEYSKKAIELINANFHEYLNGEHSISRYIIEAAYYSGKAINISKTTLPHALSYFLTIKYNIPHGHAVALTLGFVGKINFNYGDENLKKVMIDICELLNIEIKDFEKYWYNLMTHSGLETRLSNLGVDRNDLGLIIDSVNVERLKNHPLNIKRKILIEELIKRF